MIYVYIAVAAAFLLTAGWGEYEKLRAERVQNEYDAYVVKQRQIVADTTVKWAEAVQKADEGAQARLAAAKEESDALNTQVAKLTSRNVVLSASLSDVLQHAGSRASASNTGTQPPGQGATVAVPTSTAPQVYDERELGQFVVAAREAYDSARNAWQACVDQYEGVRLSTQKGS